jgi:hypothetical protein
MNQMMARKEELHDSRHMAMTIGEEVHPYESQAIASKNAIPKFGICSYL